MSIDAPYAVVLTHLPETGETMHTPFTGEHYEDPLTVAHAFRKDEEARGDFPGSLWTVTANAAAAAIRRKTWMAECGLLSDEGGTS